MWLRAVISVMGASLIASAQGKNPMVGGTANVTIADVRQSNGVIHVVDNMLMPM